MNFYKTLLTGRQQWLLKVLGSLTTTNLSKEGYLWNVWNNAEALNTITHAGSGTVCAGMALSHIFIHPRVL